MGDNAGAIDLRVSADAGAATAPTATPAAAPTAVPGSGTAGAPANGLKLYSADWSSGFNGWAGDSSWNTLRGRLVTDGNSWASTIYAPYDTGALHDYAVEARIRAINGARFGVLLRHSADGRGYIAMVDGGSAWLGIGPDAYLPAGIGDGHGFGPGSDWHTYRIEADGNEMRFLIDGAQYATATDNRYLSGGVSGISAQQSQIEVADFAVLKLH